MINDPSILVNDFKAAFLTPCAIVPDERHGGSNGQIVNEGGCTSIFHCHLHRRSAIGKFHIQIVVFPSIAKGIVQVEEHFTSVFVVKCQLGVSAISIHEVEAKRNDGQIGC